MRNRTAKSVALGGVTAALALVIMCLGGLIPVATYVCPMLCCLLGAVVLRVCGRRIGWTWYAAVALLSLLIGPDKEAAVIYLLLGYYPMVKPRLDGCRFGMVGKLLLFNGSVAAAYAGLFYLMGMDSLAAEYSALGLWGLAIMVLLGNLVFFLLDRLLGRLAYRK